MIENILFQKKDPLLEQYLVDGAALTELTPLSKINFFVGANNSGKSRLLRFLIRQLFAYQEFKVDVPYPRFPGEDEQTLSLIQISKSTFIAAIEKNLESFGEALKNEGVIMGFDDLLPASDRLTEYQLFEFYSWLRSRVHALRDRLPDPKNTLPDIEKIVESLLPFPFGVRPKTTYIPAFRSLKKFVVSKTPADKFPMTYFKLSTFEAAKSPILQYRTFLDYFIKKGENSHQETDEPYDATLRLSNIFTGESLYDTIKEHLNSPQKKRKVILDFQRFLSETFFNNAPVELHALEDERGQNVHVTIGDEPERAIHELGDGIQAIIILTFPLFVHQNSPSHLIVYEEPELFLHPGMQRIFVEALRRFQNVQAFIATHSNHLLDASFDYPEEVSVFSLEKQEPGPDTRFRLENLSSPSRPLLDLLGIRNSSVFLANCCIWVEGISDRIYLRKFLDIYQRSPARSNAVFKEDLHYSFLEFGGNNIVHYNFGSEADEDLITVHKITNRILLIHDQDTGKEQRHQKLVGKLGENYYCLDVREIENLLTVEALKATLTDYRLKEDETLVFNDIVHKDYLLRRLSEYADALTDMSKVKKIFSHAENNAARVLYNKADFARKVTAHLQSFEGLSPQAQQLTRFVYDFIARHNGKNEALSK